MSGITLFELLAPEAQEEVRELADELGWCLEDAASAYLAVTSEMLSARAVKQFRRSTPVLSLTGHKEALKGSASK